MNRRPLSLAVCLLVPFVILVLGLGLAGWQGYQASLDLRTENGRGLVPRGFTVEVTEAGKHTLWLHTYTVFEGEAYESSDRLKPGAKVLLVDESTGEAIDLNPYPSAKKSMGAERAVSLGTFEVMKPTRLGVMGSGFSDSAVLSVAPVKLAKVFRTIAEVGGVAALTLFAAILALIVLLHRRQKSMEAEAKMHA